MKKILLVMSVIAVLFLVGCNQNENIVNNKVSGEEINQQQEYNNEIDNDENDEQYSKIENKNEENVTIKVLNEERINSLKNAPNPVPDYSKEKKIEFFTLKPLEEKVVKLNGKDITLDMKISEYSFHRGEGSLINYLVYDYEVEMIDYNVTEGNNIDGRYFNNVGFFKGQAIKSGLADYETDIIEINTEQALDDIGIEVGVFKDTITDKDYLVCYVVENSYCRDAFYIYDDVGTLIYKGYYDWIFDDEGTMYLGSITPPTVGNEECIYEAPINFYTNHIIFYGMYIEFENGDKTNVEKEITNIEECANLRRLTIENGIVKDEIIKIY